MRSCIILYRGPLERSRLAFIIEGFTKVYSELVFVWVAPVVLKSGKNHFEQFIEKYQFKDVHVLNHTAGQYLKTLRLLSKIAVAYPSADLALVGFSAGFYSMSFRARRKFWFINGIPEEEGMAATMLKSLLARIKWFLSAQFVKPVLIVTVSNRMSGYVQKYFPKARIFAAPTCVDVSTFRQNGTTGKEKLFVYLGTGAPWQALDLLADIWAQIHRMDKSIRFRVISRDPRCNILATGISDGFIEFMSSSDFNDVAKWLSEGSVGFLIRRPHIVNEVSFPTKLGEYVASGLAVVSSELNWDASDYIRKHGVGILIRPESSATEAAEKILAEADSLTNSGSFREKVAACKGDLDRSTWINRLTKEIHLSSSFS